MESIRTISELQAWKHQQALSGSLSLIELARRALKAKQELDQARQSNLELLMNHSTHSKTSSIRIITNIFACAALIYLHVVVSGARPEISEIKKAVTDTIEALKTIPNVEIVKSLTWPICIAACLADGDNRTFFERLEKGVADEYGINQRVLRGISTAKECWRLRDGKGSSVAGKAYDWRDSMASLGEMVLLF
jgi:C6 transcription factor Pro1